MGYLVVMFLVAKFAALL